MDADLKQEIRYLSVRLAAIIRESAGEEVLACMEEMGGLASRVRARRQWKDMLAKRRLIRRLIIPQAYQIAHGLSLLFQLVDLCEERARLRHLRETPMPARTLCWLFRKLQQAGVSSGKLQPCLGRLEIQPELTAHSTEARRRSVVHQIGHCLALTSC